MLRRLWRLLRGRAAPSALSGFLDSLIQGFENRRAGLADQISSSDALAFFLDLYEKEADRLRETIRVQEPSLSEEERRDFFRRVDDLVRNVVVPAYARLAAPLTRRERNDFYLTPGPLHGVERAGWAVAGIALGAFVVWAPFIPLWEKEWVLPFALAGLVFPDLRRYFALRRYQAELNGLVVHGNDEVWRMEVSYLTRVSRADEDSALNDDKHLEATTGEESTKPRARLREGEGGR